MPDTRSTEFRQLPLRVHSLLAEVPMHSLSRVDLPGGRAGMTLSDINHITRFNQPDEADFGWLTQALFWLRTIIGRLLRWDEAPALIASVSWLPKLSAEDRARSLVTPGQPEGIARLLYCFEHEMLAEIINRTVHCFWVMATEKTATGYALYLAVYVRKLNWFTPIYMALVSPLLQWLIYPAIEKALLHRWQQAFPLPTNEIGNDHLVFHK